MICYVFLSISWHQHKDQNGNKSFYFLCNPWWWMHILDFIYYVPCVHVYKTINMYCLGLLCNDSKSELNISIYWYQRPLFNTVRRMCLRASKCIPIVRRVTPIPFLVSSISKGLFRTCLWVPTCRPTRNAGKQNANILLCDFL